MAPPSLIKIDYRPVFCTVHHASAKGERCTIETSFIYLFDLQPDGLVRLIFPNAFSPNSYVTSSYYDLPDGPYRLTVTPLLE
jgi:hypothetical protein